MLLPHVGYRAKFAWSDGTRVCMEICLKNWTLPLSRSLKVIGTDTNWSGIYDFLLTFHSNYCAALYCFQDIVHKLLIFSTHPYLTPPQRQLSFDRARWWGIIILSQEKSLTTSLAVWIQYTSVLDTFTFAVPRTKTRLGDRSFAVAEPQIWNSLPADLRLVDNYTRFRRLLKGHTFGWGCSA